MKGSSIVNIPGSEGSRVKQQQQHTKGDYRIKVNVHLCDTATVLLMQHVKRWDCVAEFFFFKKNTGCP